MPASHPQNPPQEPHDILVVRFGSLGDLCLLGWALARLVDRPGGADRRVTLVTKSAFAPLLARVRGIHQVIPLMDSGIRGVARLAAQLRSTSWDVVIDAHNILRSHLLLGMMGRRPDRRLAKDTAARLTFMGFGHRRVGLDRTMHHRFEDLTAGLAPVSPDTAPTRPPLDSLSRQSEGFPARDILGLAPGAQWDTKRWPEDHFATLLDMQLRDHPQGVRIFLGPREENWFAGGSLEKAALGNDRVEIIQDRSLVEVASLLSECRLLVTNDSGLLHVAEAVGTPVVAMFGPTVREFGYYPLLPGSRVLENSLDCRPCSRNGKRPCHRKDLACLRDIQPDLVHTTLNDLGGRP
jgi:heptosyltransferase-2